MSGHKTFHFLSAQKSLHMLNYQGNIPGGGADKKLDRLREKAQLMPVLKRTHPA